MRSGPIQSSERRVESQSFSERTSVVLVLFPTWWGEQGILEGRRSGSERRAGWALSFVLPSVSFLRPSFFLFLTQNIKEMYTGHPLPPFPRRDQRLERPSRKTSRRSSYACYRGRLHPITQRQELQTKVRPQREDQKSIYGSPSGSEANFRAY